MLQEMLICSIYDLYLIMVAFYSSSQTHKSLKSPPGLEDFTQSKNTPNLKLNTHYIKKLKISSFLAQKHPFTIYSILSMPPSHLSYWFRLPQSSRSSLKQTFATINTDQHPQSPYSPTLNQTSFTQQHPRQLKQHLIAFLPHPRLNLDPAHCIFLHRRLNVIDYHHFFYVSAQPRVVLDQLFLLNDQMCLAQNIVEISPHLFDLTCHDRSILLARHREKDDFVVLAEFVQKNIDVGPILQRFIVLVVVDNRAIQLKDQSVRLG